MSQFNKRVQNRDEQQTYSDAIEGIWLDASDDRSGGDQMVQTESAGSECEPPLICSEGSRLNFDIYGAGNTLE
jgi:hypothetical protein